MSSGASASPRTAAEVWARAWCLSAVVLRFQLEREWKRLPRGEREHWPDWPQKLLEVLRARRADSALSPSERALLAKAAGRLTEADLLNASWAIECLGVMAWALGDVDVIPPYDTQFSQRQLTTFDLFGEQTVDRERSRLRPEAELAHAEADAARWHWRATQTQGYFRLPGEVSGPSEFPLPLEKRQELVLRALGEDVTLAGKSWSKLTPGEFSNVRSIAIERHRALGWLCGDAPWDEVVVDTVLRDVPARPASTVPPRPTGPVERTARLPAMAKVDGLRLQLASCAAVAGRRDVARAPCDREGSRLHLAPLLVEDWAQATLPTGSSPEQERWWMIHALEARHGRSAAIAGGFTI